MSSQSQAIAIIKWGARIFALAIIAQVFLAGMALFVDADNWVAHADFARVFIIFPVVMSLLSFLARLPVAYRLKCIQLLVMVILMFVTADLASHLGFLSALHPVIAIAMFWSATALAKQAADQSRVQSQ